MLFQGQKPKEEVCEVDQSDGLGEGLNPHAIFHGLRWVLYYKFKAPPLIATFLDIQTSYLLDRRSFEDDWHGPKTYGRRLGQLAYDMPVDRPDKWNAARL